MPARYRTEVGPAAYIALHLPLTPVAARPDISLHQPTPFSGMQGWLARQGQPDTPPYWAYPWAGGAALALYLNEHREAVAGRSVVDFGAGSGLVGIAAGLAGAKSVTAIEPDRLGREALLLNAAANGVTIALADALADLDADIVLAGDVFYDADVAAVSLSTLTAAAAAGMTVLVGDPYRANLPEQALEHLADYDVPDVGGGGDVPAGVFRLRAAPAISPAGR